MSKKLFTGCVKKVEDGRSSLTWTEKSDGKVFEALISCRKNE